MSIILITGGNKGLGREAARRLLELGHRVSIGARNPALGKAAAAELGAEFVQLDVTDDASMVEKPVPDFLWISTEYTAKKSLDALARNKMRVVPGVTSKAMSVASQYAPRAIVAPIVGSFYKRMGT